MSIQSRPSKGSSQRKCTLTLGFPVSDGDNYRDLIASVPLFPYSSPLIRFVGRLFGSGQQFARPPATLSNQLFGAFRPEAWRLSKCHSKT